MSGMHGNGAVWRHLRSDRSAIETRIDPKTIRRVLAFARPHRRNILAFLAFTIINAGLVVVTPLLIQRIIDDGIAEVKRMYVRTESRGSGVAAAMLRRLEEAALDLGSPALVLETGTEQKRAIAFYEREGFSRIANFGPYVGADRSVCYSKIL